MPRDVPLPTGLKPPSRRAQLGELTLPFDMLRYGLSGYHLIGAPRGDGRPIALLPGYGASELSMRPLEAYLRHLGYHVRDWGMGRNQGEARSVRIPDLVKASEFFWLITFVLPIAFRVT